MIIRCKKWHRFVNVRCNFWHRQNLQIHKSHIRLLFASFVQYKRKGGFTMTDTLFEQLGGTYTQTGDYLLPDLSLPAEKETGNIGVWALRHKRYIKQHHKVLYYNLLTSGKLDSYLADIEEQAQQLFLRLVKELAEKEGVTEQLKAADQMAWVRRMNNTRSRATEIVVKEINCI